MPIKTRILSGLALTAFLAPSIALAGYITVIGAQQHHQQTQEALAMTKTALQSLHNEENDYKLLLTNPAGEGEQQLRNHANAILANLTTWRNSGNPLDPFFLEIKEDFRHVQSSFDLLRPSMIEKKSREQEADERFDYYGNGVYYDRATGYYIHLNGGN